MAWTAARTISRAWVVGRLGAAGGLLVVPMAVEVTGKLAVLLIKLTIVRWGLCESIPPVRILASLVTNAEALTVVVVVAVTVVPEVAAIGAVTSHKAPPYRR